MENDYEYFMNFPEPTTKEQREAIKLATETAYSMLDQKVLETQLSEALMNLLKNIDKEYDYMSCGSYNVVPVEGTDDFQFEITGYIGFHERDEEIKPLKIVW
jgi:hypothetical protein